MMRRFLVLYLCALVVQECVCYFYPPVFWHWQNCVFRQLKESYGTNETKEFYMKVLPYNAMNIVCPNDGAVNDWLGSQFPHDMYENMWMVDKQGYDNCMVNEKNPKFNKKILDCTDSKKIQYKLFQFHQRYNTEEPMFAPGYHYYFISTSKGRKKEHLQSKSGGHCKTTHMKLHIYVCDPKKEDCIWEMPRCRPPYEMMKHMKGYTLSLPAETRAPLTVTVPPPPATFAWEDTTTRDQIETTTREETEESANFPTAGKDVVGIPNDSQTRKQCDEDEDKGTSVNMILNFVLGGVILFMAVVIVILACGLARRSADSKARPTSVAFSAMAQEPSIHLYEETARFMHPPATPLSKSPPQTPLSANPHFCLQPMSEIRPTSPSNRGRRLYSSSGDLPETRTVKGL